MTPHKEQLLSIAARTTQPELRWHLAQILPRLPLTSAERVKAAAILRGWLDGRSAIVKTCALQGLADLASPALRTKVDRLLKRYVKEGTPAVRARCRKLLARGPMADG